MYSITGTENNLNGRKFFVTDIYEFFLLLIPVSVLHFIFFKRLFFLFSLQNLVVFLFLVILAIFYDSASTKSYGYHSSGSSTLVTGMFLKFTIPVPVFIHCFLQLVRSDRNISIF